MFKFKRIYFSIALCWSSLKVLKVVLNDELVNWHFPWNFEPMLLRGVIFILWERKDDSSPKNQKSSKISSKFRVKVVYCENTCESIRQTLLSPEIMRCHVIKWKNCKKAIFHRKYSTIVQLFSANFNFGIQPTDSKTKSQRFRVKFLAHRAG
jgi:hypothetical protein